jgi:hypothetical protein
MSTGQVERLSATFYRTSGREAGSPWEAVWWRAGAPLKLREWGQKATRRWVGKGRRRGGTCSLVP